MGPSSGRRRRAIPYAPACTDVADPVLSNFTSLPGQWMYRTAVNSSALVVSSLNSGARPKRTSMCQMAVFLMVQ
jgi:hypothetical protein